MTGRARVLVASTSTVDRHDTGRRHPEAPGRLAAVERGFETAGLGEALGSLEPRQATVEELGRVHDRRYLAALRSFVDSGGGSLDPDTPAAPGSWETALWAAGSGLAAIDALERGEASSAFVAVRPPGHHATATRAMGFCLLNNAAIAAATLADRGERVVLIDWDVHHGNGTQEIFWDDERVLYISTHEWPAYPGTGRATDTGGPNAQGLTVNVPLPSGATGDVALAAVDEVAAPVVEAFGPTWVLISAGYDAHRDDPLADLAWSAADYADLTRRVMAWAPQEGRIIAFLEGGYDDEALTNSVAATVSTLGGDEVRPEPATGGGPGRDHVRAALRFRQRQLEDGSP